MHVKTRYFEDYEIGASRVSFGRTITETDFVVHAGHTGDFFPHHLDLEFCKTQDFGQRIAHGTMVFAIGVGLTASEINPVAFSYGYERMRFIRPVFIGDTLRSHTMISRKELDAKRPGMGQVFEKLSVLNQKDETVLAAEHIYLVEMKGPL